MRNNLSQDFRIGTLTKTAPFEQKNKQSLFQFLSNPLIEGNQVNSEQQWSVDKKIRRSLHERGSSLTSNQL